MKRWLILFVCLGFGPNCLTVRGEEAIPLTLKEARALTLANHPKITQAELEALASKQVVKENRSAYLPTATFNATAVGTGGSNTRLAAGNGLSNPAIYEREADGLNLNQLLTDFGRTTHLVSSSRLSSRAAEAGTDATRNEILLELNVAFFNALKTEAVLTVARQTVDSRKLLLDQVAALTTNQLRSELDLSFADVSYEEGKLLLAKAQNDEQAAFTALSTLLGDREPRTYKLIEENSPPSAPIDASGLVDQALSKRPDLARLRLERDAAVQFTKAQRALQYPTINAFGSGGFIPVRDAAHFDDHYLAAGVNLSLPLFDGGLNSAKRSEAQLRSQAADEILRDAENNAIRDVRTAGLNLNYSIERLGLTEKFFENANHALELAAARFKLGSSSIVELSQAQLNQTEAEIDHTSAKYDYEIQQAILNFQIGVWQ